MSNKEDDVYRFYNEKVKVIYSEIEALNNTLPVELLFEIHASFDHLKRFHLKEESEEESVEKVLSHLKRGALDAYKLRLKYHNNEYNNIINNKSDLKIVDNGNFIIRLLKARKTINNKAKEARLYEGKKNMDEAFEKWVEVSTLINEFEEEYFNPEKIGWAKTQKYFRITRDNILSFVLGGLVSGILLKVLFK